MKLAQLNNKKIIIIGKGVEGEAAYNYLSKHLTNAKLKLVDQKDNKNYLKEQENFDLAIKSPGVAANLLKIPYTTCTNIFFANHKGRTIGVTGTKGKSTTATLIFEMLKKKRNNVFLAGNIGKASVDLLDTLNDQSISVLELSSFQLQDIKYSPNVAVLLMITSEHLDYHKDILSYINAKRNILRFQNKNDFAVINRDYIASNESDILTNAKTYYISRERKTENGCFALGGKIIVRINGQDEEIIKTAQIKLLGAHNLENVCAAVMVAKIEGVTNRDIVSILTSFSGLEHRLEFVGTKQGIDFYNDSLSTIPEAAIEAIETFDQKVQTLIAGGFDRGLDYKKLAQALLKSNINTLILFSPSGKRIWEEVVKLGGQSKFKKYDVNNMKQAVIYALDETDSDRICLLSPASASFGTFKDYKDRGEQFKKLVNAIPQS